jgi:hypothetical protein
MRMTLKAAKNGVYGHLSWYASARLFDINVT